ncbi:PGN_0703 family putative restriction endonuclease [Methylobacterium sp. P31]
MVDPASPLTIYLTRLTHPPVIPDPIRRQHAAFIAGDTSFAAAARLLASLWRADQNLTAGVHAELGPSSRTKARKLRAGWRLRRDAAQAGLAFLNPDIAAFVHRALILREPGAMWDEPKIRGNLLASQGLALNLFVPLALDLSLASRVFSALLPGFVQAVTHITFETSPGRGDPTYLGDGTAFDIRLDVITTDGEPAFVAIELKFIEAMLGPSASARPRYHEVAHGSRLFRNPDDPLLYRPGLEQLRREHTLAQLMVDQGHAARGLFVLVGPALNRRVAASAKVYANALINPTGATPDRVGFIHLTLETILAALSQAGLPEHAQALHARYLDFRRVTAVALGEDDGGSPQPPSSPLALPPPCHSSASTQLAYRTASGVDPATGATLQPHPDASASRPGACGSAASSRSLRSQRLSRRPPTSPPRPSASRSPKTGKAALSESRR